LRPARAAKLLGTSVSNDECLTILQSLGCTIVENDNRAIEAEVPSWRPDLQREVDLIEEVARVRGYDEIPTAVPRVHPSEAGTPGLLKTIDALRDAAVAAGLYEAINYGFVSTEELRKARVSIEAVTLANPLSEERAVMRTSLMPGLTGAAARAQRHGARQARLFEIARTFQPHDDLLPVEETRLAIVLAGDRAGWIGGEQPFDLYDGKGAIEAVLDSVLGRRPLLVPGEVPAFLHPKRSAVVTLESRTVGFVGEIHPEVADDLELVGRVIYAELDVVALHAISEELGPMQAQGLPKFPAVNRDIAMLVREEFTSGEIADALQEASGGLAESVTLFDLYRGDQIPEGHRSLAFRVTYRDPEATLTDKRVDKVHASLARVARDRFEATLR
jgi:phenylalanyl-tRNA synthetase beta chain